MLGERLKELRNEKLMSIEEVANIVQKSKSTVSRYENNLVQKKDLELIEKFADALDTSSAYLLAMTEDSYYVPEVKRKEQLADDDVMNILVTENTLAPDIPEGACVQVRELEENEELDIGDYYYIEFNNKKVFRMLVEDVIDGVGFLPMDMSERRIAYDSDYVKIIGKAVSMKVFFEDDSNCYSCK